MEKILYYLNPYRIYYRIYYYLFGMWRISHPKKVTPPANAINCFAEFDSESRKHHNFLYAQVKPLKWFFWLRKFAFRIGDGPWQLLPRLTPWGTKEHLTKFGLNYTFVQKLTFWERVEIRFITWI